MQGEADLYADLNVYEMYLKAFITDLRKDLVSITADQDLQMMPFVIGEIATSFGVSNHPMVPSMIAKQRKVAEEMGTSVTTIPTDDLIIVNPDGSYNRVDIYHFAAKDIETLGKRFANEILRLQNVKQLSTNVENGKISYKIQDDVLTVELKPQEHTYLDTISLNEQDVKSSVVDGVLQIALTERLNTLNVKFSEKQKISLTYEKNEYAEPLLFPKSFYTGETISLTIMPYKGYRIDGVYHNDVAMIYNEETKRYEAIATADGVISIQTSSISDPEPEEPQEESSGGCNSAAVGGAWSIAAAGIAVLCIKKTRRYK